MRQSAVLSNNFRSLADSMQCVTYRPTAPQNAVIVTMITTGHTAMHGDSNFSYDSLE